MQAKDRQGSTRTMLKIMFRHPAKKAGRQCVLWLLGISERFSVVFVSVTNFLACEGMKY